jgi:hypothetical protein
VRPGTDTPAVVDHDHIDPTNSNTADDASDHGDHVAARDDAAQHSPGVPGRFLLDR